MTAYHAPRTEPARDASASGDRTARAPAGCESEGTFSRLFGLDVRSLALARVVIGALVLVDLAIRARDLVAFYTDAGLLPRAAWLRAYSGSLSLHAASGHPAWLAFLFAVQACAAAMLIVGWRTRLSTFVNWLLLVSLHARNPAVLQGGDSLLALLLFWSFFVPLGATFSIDAAMTEPAPAPRRVVSVGTMALALQMPFVYFFTALLKGGPEWHTTFDAIRNALRDDFIAAPLGAWLAETLPAGVLRGMTIAVLAVEILIPVALLSPIRTASVRMVLLPLLLALQIGFFFCLRIGLFPFISTAATLALVPTEAWQRLAAFWTARRARFLRVERRALRLYARARRSRVFAATVARFGAGAPRFGPGRLGSVACGLALAFALADNVNSVMPARILPRPVTEIGRTLHLRQNWKLFIRSSKVRRWIVLEGILRDGRHVDLLTGSDEPPSASRPEHISDSFENYRWRKYYGNVSSKKRTQVQRRALATYLCKAGNAGRSDDERLESVVAYRYAEPATGPVGASQPDRTRLFRKRCAPPKSDKRRELAAAR